MSADLSSYATQRFSEVALRDGFGLELIERGTGRVVAEAFASDAEDAAFTLTTFGAPVPVVVLEWFINKARDGIATYTDGRPLPRLARVPDA